MIKTIKEKLFPFLLLTRLLKKNGIGYYWIRVKGTVRDEGVMGVFRIISPFFPFLQHLGVDFHKDYQIWTKRYAPALSDQVIIEMLSELGKCGLQPLISIIMPTYNSNVVLLKAAIESVRNQVYTGWELCIADDASSNTEVIDLLKWYAALDKRIKVRFNQSNQHISENSNSALDLACGEWIALLDHDDLLAPEALYWVVKTINHHPNAQLIYSDEDKITDQGKRYDPYFKPDWNYDLLLSQNFFCHLGVYRTGLMKKVGGFRAGYEGAQDYDLVLRCLNYVKPKDIIHIPKVLYHWRAIDGSTAKGVDEKQYAVDAGERALNDYFKSNHISAYAEKLPFGMYRTHYSLPAHDLPLVSLIIPTYNGLDLLRQCIESVKSKTDYQHYEILVIDNRSDDPEILRYFDEISKLKHIRVLKYPHPFNYSAINNFGVEQAQGDYVLLLNNDIEVRTKSWLSHMMSIALQPGVGVVGSKLYYPDNTIQHAGVIVGLGGVAAHAYLNLSQHDFGYFGRARVMQSLSAVTAACLLVKKSHYELVGGLDAEHLKIAFNDVDFCLKLREAGYRNVWTPFAELYHHESASRGYEDTPEKQSRFNSEVAFMHAKWGEALAFDPAYSVNLSLARGDFAYAWPPREKS